MPRAENRKKPASAVGNTWDSKHGTKNYGSQSTTGAQNVQSKKQELVEKMKKQLESKKAEQNNK
ncbi:MAG: hypothetical protein A2201_02780 [Alicyclobacillus sp. RIFOXYA1_FULL_53_8]|nr:MAG: hypothetical protein A2201_02780 [Alicyclobacillus sp. RIFOXYA1_FULL_53_8]